MGRKGREMIGWLSLGLNSSGSEELQHWNDMRAARQPTQIQRWHSLLRPWTILSWKSSCYGETFYVNDNDMVWLREYDAYNARSLRTVIYDWSYSKATEFFKTNGCSLLDAVCTARTEHRSQYVDLLILRIRAVIILAHGNSEFKTLSMYQVHSFLIRRTELRVFSTYILRMYITYASKEKKRKKKTERER